MKDEAGEADGGAVGEADGVLAAHIAKDDDYTPPSIEFDLTASAPAGSVLTLAFRRYSVTANVFILGNLRSVCRPRPRRFPVGTTRVQRSAR